MLPPKASQRRESGPRGPSQAAKVLLPPFLASNLAVKLFDRNDLQPAFSLSTFDNLLELSRIYRGIAYAYDSGMQGNIRKNKVRLLRALGAFTFAILIWTANSSVRAVTFTAQNFEINFPPGWQQITPTPQGAIFVSRSPDGSKVVVVNAGEVPASERNAGIAEALAGSKETAVKRGFPTDPEQSLTVNGVPFRYYVAHQTTAGTMATYAAVAGHELYVLALVNNHGDTSTDSELQTIVQSFRLITPTEIPRSVDVSKSAGNDAAFQMGRVFGMLFVLAIFIAIPICGVALFVWFVFFRRKTSSTGQAPPTLPPQVPPKNDDKNRQ
jgi:hypothetical protein